MKIGILYICTGKYSMFWKDFYQSCEQYFITGAQKHYYVFTDAPEVDFEKENPNIHRIFQENLGWPFNTLMRFEMFRSQREALGGYDYLFFFNANMLFISPITESEFLPQEGQTLVACLHPGYYRKDPDHYPYEKDENSTACVSPGNGHVYVQGALQGGCGAQFLQVIDELADCTQKDLDNGIIALVHDESHWNRYVNGRADVRVLSPAYIYPEGQRLPLKKKAITRDKKRLGGHNALRGVSGEADPKAPGLLSVYLKLILNRIRKVFSPQ